MEQEQEQEHYTIREIATKMHVSYDTARRMFQNEPGVAKLRGTPSPTGHRRGYTLLRVPVEVYERVLRRSTVEAEPEGRGRGKKRGA